MSSVPDDYLEPPDKMLLPTDITLHVKKMFLVLGSAGVEDREEISQIQQSLI